MGNRFLFGADVKQKKNTQARLSPVAIAVLDALALKKEGLQLREQLLAAETRIFQLELQRDYGNPGERVQLDRAGGIVRVPVAPGAPPAAPPIGHGLDKAPKAPTRKAPK
jgi:hypothetical protein